MSEELQEYIAAWRAEADSVLELAASVHGPAWAHETDLPGWTTKDVLAHLAHLEAVLAGHEDGSRMPELDGRSPNHAYTHAGVDARRDRTPEELADEFRAAVEARAQQLTADPPTDPEGRPAVLFSGLDWDNRTLLSNRVVDLWMHEQDIRRAVRMPGNLDGAGARHTFAVFLRAWPMVLAKRVKIGDGDVVRLVVGDRDERYTWAFGDGRVVESDADPTVTITMSSEELCLLAGGRRPAEALTVHVEGDNAVGERILASLTVTP